MQSVVALQRCIVRTVEYLLCCPSNSSIASAPTSKLFTFAHRKLWIATRVMSAFALQTFPGHTCSAKFYSSYPMNLPKSFSVDSLRCTTHSLASSTFLQIGVSPMLGDKEAPSNALVSALVETGHAYAVYTPRRCGRRSRMSRQVANKLHGIKILRFAKSNLSLQDVLARYLQYLHADVVSGGFLVNPSTYNEAEIDRRILHTFDDESIALLHYKGYDVGDVVAWATILTTKSSYKAASILMALSNKLDEMTPSLTKPLPGFLFFFFLRRSQISASALRLVIEHGWDLLNNRVNPRWTLTKLNGSDQGLEKLDSMAASYPKLNEDVIMLMIVRLLRHARKVWPESLRSIASMLIKHVDGGSSLGETLDRATSARLSFFYNEVLCLLAIPSSPNPYRSTPYHQRSQFDIIMRMNQFVPALIISRQGYRAIARVQLAHRQTLQERKWARIKSKSWPPWKEDEVGIDADLGTEIGVSRAHKVLERMKESGYAHHAWEKSAKILSGWDTDNSPTIQTREFLQSRASPTGIRLSTGLSRSKLASSGIWAARIKSTRTVNEAWACFLSYKAKCSTPSLEVYHRMLEKIAFDYKRRHEEAQLRRKEGYGILPRVASDEFGDGKEVAAPPADPRDHVYVRKSLPTLQGLFNDMIADGVRPSGRCLAFLLDQAHSIHEGVGYLKSSDLPTRIIWLLTMWNKGCGLKAIKKLKDIPNYVFAACIRLLCRFSAPKPSLKSNANVQTSNFLHASLLVHAHKPLYRPPWYSLLAVLASPPRFTRDMTLKDQAAQYASNWISMLSIVDEMSKLDLELDFSGFRMVCVGFEKAVLASQLSPDTHQPVILKWKGTGQHDWRHQPVIHNSRRAGQHYWRLQPAERDRSGLVADEFVDRGRKRLKAMFERLVLGDSQQVKTRVFGDRILQSWSAAVNSGVSLPQLLAVPAPADLHALVRALGLSKDYQGIFDLVLWMVRFAPELKSVAEELKTGSIMMRRCLIAVRASLEGKLQYSNTSEQMEENIPVSAPASMLDDLMVKLDTMDKWGGWPMDEEVDDYVESFKTSRID